MTDLRAAKIAGIANDIPPLDVDDPDGDAELLILGVGLVARHRACRRPGACGPTGTRWRRAHLRHLNPFPSNTGDVVTSYRKVLIPEMNSGQLAMLIRARFLVDAISFTKVQGMPIFADDLEQEILRVLDDE